MTFNVNVPNQSQSPGLFPAQNNTNFNRIKLNIDSNHFFLDTAGATQGYHKKVSLINLSATPVGLDSASAILYSLTDGSASQLHYYNGGADYQLTPPDQVSPIRFVTAIPLAANQTLDAYAAQPFLWAGTAWGITQNTNHYVLYNIIRSGTNEIHATDTFNQDVSLFFVGDVLRVQNLKNFPLTAVVSLIINRL